MPLVRSGLAFDSWLVAPRVPHLDDVHCEVIQAILAC